MKVNIKVKQGHANIHFILQLDKLAYAGKSFMVHINAARNWNLVLEDALYD